MYLLNFSNEFENGKSNKYNSKKTQELFRLITENNPKVIGFCSAIFQNSNKIKAKLLELNISLFTLSVKYADITEILNENILSVLLDDFIDKPSVRLEIMRCIQAICI